MKLRLKEQWFCSHQQRKNNGVVNLMPYFQQCVPSSILHTIWYEMKSESARKKPTRAGFELATPDFVLRCSTN